MRPLEYNPQLLEQLRGAEGSELMLELGRLRDGAEIPHLQLLLLSAPLSHQGGSEHTGQAHC